ncbi:hypothetical protein CVT25_012576 [Psilocybe cyanescens]|uniref:Uncharacterized protein n=1 Tax=Psilocybe cyanescens TaxID=93625 RepID=A0A409X7W8_PSICY|nr:hypothetical protein CVT25_012576 [Psilocybe cyanescens]
MSSQPAHLTKHISHLSYPFASSTFALSQLDDGFSNGTALWLGGQCLALYLAQMHAKLKPVNLSRPPRAIELGSGIGLTAYVLLAVTDLRITQDYSNRLALSSLGWDVLATDIPHVISSVLEKNIKNNLPALPMGSGLIQIRELDWSVPPDKWTWNHELGIASPSVLPPAVESSVLLRPPFDLIFSADTVYATELIEPMLRTLHALSTSSASASGLHFPPILLCIERRDPQLVDRLLASAKDNWNFSVERIPNKKVVKAIEKGVQWDKAEWEGVEMWKLRLHGSRP